MRTRFSKCIKILPPVAIVLIFMMATSLFSAHLDGTYTANAQSANLTSEQIEKREKELRAELAKTEKEIAEWRVFLTQKQGEAASLARDAAILNAKIKEAQLVIKARNLSIERLGKDINEKVKTISTLDEKISRSKDSLSQLIRKTNEIDSYSIAEVALSNQNISGFFSDLDSFDFVKRSLNEKLDEIREVKEENLNAKQSLSKKRDEEADAKAVIEAEKRRVEKNEAEKKQLLAVARSQEKTYSQIVAEREKKAAQIRSALFALRDSAAIPFGTALNYANIANQKTGVRQAFILAILEQESNLGQNVGSCVITNLQSGETRGVNSGKIFANGIHPTRDLPLLQDILGALGRDPLMTKVSCPFTIGYGGAMGPAQFIPSTWNIMKAKISAAVNKITPDPWDPSDAIMASALFLKDLGAGAATYTAELNAACRYYSGKPCSAGTGANYGNSVMLKAKNIQENMIDPLQIY